MPATITWTISQLDCYPSEDGKTDVVVTAHWQCSGEQAEGETVYTSSVYATSSFTLDPDAPFIPYSQLTQEDVLNWVWSSGVDKDSAEATVQQQIDNQINPPIISPPLPWVTQNPAV